MRHFKNKKIIIGIILLTLLIIVFIYFIGQNDKKNKSNIPLNQQEISNKEYKNDKYTLKIITFDSYSPDRNIEIYEENKKIEFKELKYLDGIVICKGTHSVISYLDLINEKEIIVVLKDNKEIKIKLSEE